MLLRVAGLLSLRKERGLMVGVSIEDSEEEGSLSVEEERGSSRNLGTERELPSEEVRRLLGQNGTREARAERTLKMPRVEMGEDSACSSSTAFE